jgi:hypothetical protein
MKTIATLAGLSVIALASLADTPPVDTHDEAAAHLAENLVTALRLQSSDEFIRLFPSVDQFHSLMQNNAGLYASSLAAAKQDFARTYQRDLIPALRAVFNQLIADGIEMGIDWKSVQNRGWEIVPMGETQTLQLSIVIESRGTKHKVIIENALIIGTVMYVGSHIRIS